MTVSTLYSILLIFGTTYGDKFTEELLITPLASGHLSVFFKFTTVIPGDIRESSSWTDYDLISRPLGGLVSAYSVQELSVALTQGVWRHASWGYPVTSSPPGASVSARFLPSVALEAVDSTWEGLTDGLAGLMCASLNKLDRTQAVTPVYSFQPRGLVGQNLTGDASHFRYGLLPKENVCTENLTPWKKLLPCKGKRGLAVLLNSGHIQKHSSYQSLGLEVRSVCEDPDNCDSISTEFSQTLTLVFDPAIYNSNPTNTDWSLKKLFGIGLSSKCPMATSSSMFVDLTGSSFSLSPKPDRELVTGGGTNVRQYGVYDMARWSQDGRIRDLAASHIRPHIYGIVPSPGLTISRHLTGLGQERGGIRATLRNTLKEEVTVVYLDIIPWYLRIYMHTLTITSNGRALEPKKMRFSPGIDRIKPYHIELVLTLPPKSTTQISVQFELSLLRWVEYPPDANHGFYVGSASISARIPDNKNVTMLAPEDSTLSYTIWGNPPSLNTVVTLYSETLLVTLPTPDFSMPYNVICLACTVAALAFGPIHNITTKSLGVVSPGEVEPGMLTKLFLKLKKLLRLDKGKATEEKNDENKDEDQESTHGDNKEKTD